MENTVIAEIFEFIDDGNFKKADSLCNELLREYPENASLHLAKLMIEMQAKNANQIKANLPMYIDSENYKNAVKYDDGQFTSVLKYSKRKARKYSRKKSKKGLVFVLVILLIAALVASYFYVLPMVNYNRAYGYLENGKFKEAYDIFEGLDYKNSASLAEEALCEYAAQLFDEGQYKDALALLDTANDSDSENLKKVRYNCAMAAMNGFDYNEAVLAFEFLGSYQDSSQKLENCYKYQACELSDIGDRDGAVNILEKIGLGEEDIFSVKYDHGTFLLDHQMYYDAKLHYAVLGDYRDCVMKIKAIDEMTDGAVYTVTDNPDDESASIGEFTDYSEAFAEAVANEGYHIYDELGCMFY